MELNFKLRTVENPPKVVEKPKGPHTAKTLKYFNR